MDKKIQNVLLGAGAAIAITAITVYLASDEVQEKTNATVNRMRAKQFVRRNLNGNEKATQAIDNMSDSDINSLLETVDKYESIKDEFAQYGDKISDKAKDVYENTKANVNDALNR